MLSYDWIVMITLGLDRWDSRQRAFTPHEIEREEARKRHEARQAFKPAAPSLLQRLFSRQRTYHLPQPPHPAQPQRRASRV